MENEKLFEFMEKMYSEMQQGFKEVRGDIKEMKTNISGVKNDIKKIYFNIEALDRKVDYSLEGHKTDMEQINRIETEVSKQQEVKQT